MAFNGSGTFNLPAGNPVVTGTSISSTVHNSTNTELAAGLTNALCKDGQSTPTANIKLGGFKLTGLGAATVAGDAVRFEQITGPAFRAYNASGQTLGNSTYKLQFPTESFDTNSYFDSATNYRFTPLIAGYYQFSTMANVYSATVCEARISFRKNTSTIVSEALVASAATPNYQCLALSDLVYMNGSTDYIEVYSTTNSTTSSILATGPMFFSGALVRIA